MTAIDITALQAWVGKQERHSDVVTSAPVAGLSAALDYAAPRAQTGMALPQPWHWLYFLPAAAASQVDTDGHPVRGGFLPPVPLPRRMWAGSSLRFESPLLVGDAIERTSTIKAISLKEGSTGPLVFVSVEHEVFSGERLAIHEQQQLVYRAAATTNTAQNTPPPAKPTSFDAQWCRASIRILCYCFAILR